MKQMPFQMSFVVQCLPVGWCEGALPDSWCLCSKKIHTVASTQDSGTAKFSSKSLFEDLRGGKRDQEVFLNSFRPFHWVVFLTRVTEKWLVRGLPWWGQARKDAVCILWSEFSRGPYARWHGNYVCIFISWVWLVVMKLTLTVSYHQAADSSCYLLGVGQMLAS